MKKSLPYIGGYLTKWLIVAVIAGIGGGLSSTALKKSINIVSGYSDGLPLFLAPLVGGIIVSALYLWDIKAAGFGTDRYISEVNVESGHLKIKTFFSKLMATATTLGFSGSGGVEGPMLVIGGSISHAISKVPILRNYFNEKDGRTLVICGAAGAIGAILHSPLGGGIFVVEILYNSSLHYDDLIPALLSSTMGFLVYSIVLNPNHSPTMFSLPEYDLSFHSMPFFIMSAILAAFISLLFMSIFGFVQRAFLEIPRKKLHPIIGGGLTGIILLFIPKAGGVGSDIIQEMIDSEFSIAILLILLFGKMFATSFTIGSGGSGGLVIPALFVGALSGNIIATALSGTDPSLTSALVVSGMAASLAGIANVPIAASIMVVEMAGVSFGIPAVVGSVIGYAIGHSRVIYGVVHPDQSQFKEIHEWKQYDVKKGSH
ncbi:voltage-gated ClC-type chloride channel ClcB [Andreesenia angusta]|uniref:Voltage-gated ClC-type chloride channel ClcB n=1 Tax=Andreesenia angusta TaxID=39480 RepID=A0A1S1V8G3_9FIRM|nr:chloride channel protein [Andreesenia angusta]OHW62882.1 voltage-gated ClC-type chloride channel ClcB [Andreesenia angusta]